MLSAEQRKYRRTAAAHHGGDAASAVHPLLQLLAHRTHGKSHILEDIAHRCFYFLHIARCDTFDESRRFGVLQNATERSGVMISPIPSANTHVAPPFTPRSCCWLAAADMIQNGTSAPIF